MKKREEIIDYKMVMLMIEQRKRLASLFVF